MIDNDIIKNWIEFVSNPDNNLLNCICYTEGKFLNQTIEIVCPLYTIRFVFERGGFWINSSEMEFIFYSNMKTKQDFLDSFSFIFKAIQLDECKIIII